MIQPLKFFKTFYNKRRIREKLFFLIISITGIAFLLTLAVVQFANNLVKEQHLQVSAQVLNISSSIITNELTKIETLSLNIAVDKVVQDYFTTLLTVTPENQYIVNRIDLDETLFNYSNSDNYIDSIHAISLNEFEVNIGKRELPINPLAKESILDLAALANGKNIWYTDNNDKWLYCARSVREVKNFTLDQLGTIIIRINKEGLIKKHSHLFNEFDSTVLIFLEDNLVFTSSSPDLIDVINIPNSRNGYMMQTLDGEDYFVAFSKVKYTDWMYMNIIPYNHITSQIKSINTFTYIFFSLIFVISFIIIFLFSKQFTKPIAKLASNMNTVEKGIFDITKMDFESYHSEDEIGQLEHDFELMIREINTLINENYLKQLTIKDAKYRALQSQVNPHFLYNTLTSINALAKISKQEKISTMVEALSNLFRFSVNNDKPLIKLSDEIKILENYMAIQKIRYQSRLNYTLNIEQGYWDYMIPPFTLQPLVENSIKYGISEKRTNGFIKISCFEKNDILFIHVTDNGPGMNPNYLDIIDASSNTSNHIGIGLRNINARIKLMFGEAYGLAIKSSQGQGTTIIISLPKGSDYLGGTHV
jgi:two-component system sensor histidine kinase YesM